MIIDFNDSDASPDWKADVCIVGAGAAGITLAIALARSNLQVVLLEAGGFEPEADSQSLYGAQSIGQQLSDPMSCRLRHFGGTTNHWEGWCAELDDSDFARRPWIPLSGWPLTRAELAPYYKAAALTCEIPDTTPDTTTPEAFVSTGLLRRFWRYSPPTRFGTRYRAAIRDNVRIRLLLHANLLRLECDQAGRRVNRVRFRNYGGTEGQVEARACILACGGMENPRFLLAATGHGNGIGNSSGLVGRCFMQHIELQPARILSDQPGSIKGLFTRDGASAPHMVFDPEVERKHRLHRCGLSISTDAGNSRAYNAFSEITGSIGSGEWPDEFGEHLRTVLGDLRGLARDTLRQLRSEPSNLSLKVYAEQAPDPSSRVYLSDETDRFGLRKLVVDWKPGIEDKRSIRDTVLTLAAEFGRLQLGRFHVDEWLLADDNSWPGYIWSGCHHMGTTRMSSSPREGVVNADCRLHDVENLYVAGSSVFPTGGYVMPTLTIVALAYRLADHLRETLR